MSIKIGHQPNPDYPAISSTKFDMNSVSLNGMEGYIKTFCEGTEEGEKVITLFKQLLNCESKEDKSGKFQEFQKAVKEYKDIYNLDNNNAVSGLEIKRYLDCLDRLVLHLGNLI